MSFAGVSFIGGSGLGTECTVTDSGYHLLVINGYSRTKETTPNGAWIESLPFRVGGHRWRIQYSPNGRDSDVADYISLYLKLDDDNIVGTVTAQFDFSFVDKAEKQLPSNIQEIEVNNFRKPIRRDRHISTWGYDDFMKREDLEKSAHLKDDSLTIKCDIIVTKDVVDVSTGANTAPFDFVVVPASDMHQHFSRLLQSAEGSDVTFEIGGEILAAHQCVLACRSTVFKGMLLGSMNKGMTAGVIRIDNMEARVFKLLLGFIYSDSMPEMEGEDGDVMWQHLLVAADRYDLPRLRLICEEKLCTYINTSTAATILVLAERHHGHGLKDACLDFLIRAHANLQEVMVLGGLDHLASTCPLVLKELIAKLVSPNKKARIDVNTAFVVVPASDMHQHFTRLLQSGEGTDVVFEVSGEKLHAHRCVLAARSVVFRAELFGPMKEGTTTGVIRIDDMEAKVFKLLLSFIYSDSIQDINEDEEEDDEEDMEEEKDDDEEDMGEDKDDDEEDEDDDDDDDDDEEDMEEEKDDDVDDVEIWQHLLVAADRYDLQRLRLMCEDKLCGYINATRLAGILELAEQHQCQGLKEACLEFLDFPPNLQQVMAVGGLNHLRSSCPSVLIDLIAKLACLKPHN